jgi:hypothetical protein
MTEITMKNFKHEFKEWLIVVAQGSVFLVMFVVFIFAAMSAGCGGQETVRPSVDTEEVSDTEDSDEGADESVDETADEVVDEEESDEEESDEEDSDIEAPDEEEDSDEVPDEAVEGWTQVVTTRSLEVSSDGIYDARTCGIYKKQLYCWGSNIEGSFGNGTLEDSSYPVLSGGNKLWQMVAVRPSMTCGLDLEGYVYCWGYNIWNDILGPVTEPFKISDRKFADINYIPDSGYCGLTDTKEEWCWDWENHRMNFQRTVTAEYWPDIVDSMSYYSKNDWTGATTGGGVAVYIYGDWYTFPSPLRNIPEVSLLTKIDGSATKKETGAGTYCATDLNDSLWCWSSHKNAILGVPDSYKSKTEEYEFWYSNLVSDVYNFSTSSTHTCAIKKGQLFCWGENRRGQLGLGSKTETPLYSPTVVLIN